MAFLSFSLNTILPALVLIIFVKHCLAISGTLTKTEIKYGNSCDFKLFTNFVKDSMTLGIYTILSSDDHDHGYFNHFKEICVEVLEVSGELVIDAHKFDCRKENGNPVCSCGAAMYKIDPLLSPFNKTTQTSYNWEFREYMKVTGLDRRLVVENETCVSGTGGHCTLQENEANRTAPGLVMKCRDKHECRITSKSFTSTAEKYGSCVKLGHGNFTTSGTTSGRTKWIDMAFWLILIMSLYAN